MSNFEPNERDLVLRAREGDRMAFGLLVDRHKNAVARIFSGRGMGDIDGLSQETFLEAWKSRRHLGPPYNFRAWTRKIAERVLRKRRDKLRKDRDVLQKLGEAQKNKQEGRWSGLDVELAQQVADQVGRLPDDVRALLIDRVCNNLTWTELAERYGLPSTTVRRQVQDVLDVLEQRLSPAWSGTLKRPKSKAGTKVGKVREP